MKRTRTNSQKPEKKTDAKRAGKKTTKTATEKKRRGPDETPDELKNWRKGVPDVVCERKCPCKTCSPKNSAACFQCNAGGDECSTCRTYIFTMKLAARYAWVSPFPQIRFSKEKGNRETFRALSPEITKKLGLVKSAILSELHYRARVQQPDEDGIQWYEVRLSHIAHALKVSWRNVLRIVHEFRDDGIIVCQPVPDKSQTFQYAINYSKLWKMLDETYDTLSQVEEDSESSDSE